MTRVIEPSCVLVKVQLTGLAALTSTVTLSVPLTPLLQLTLAV